jgi:hypothetical protein
MYLSDDEIRPSLENTARAAWNPVNLRPDIVRTEQVGADLPDVRIRLVSGQSQATGGGAASRDVIVPHTYEITGRWTYPTGDDDTVNREQIARFNEIVSFLTADYPLYAGWRYSEEIGWEFEDNPTEETYDVTVTFTLLVVTRAGIPGR